MTPADSFDLALGLYIAVCALLVLHRWVCGRWM